MRFPHTRGRDRLAAIVREPLVQFLLIGGLLFAASRLLPNSSRAADLQTIVVDRNAIVTFMQYRANAFEGELFNKQFEQLSDEQRQALVAQYVREEAMYREALSMGLENEDYIIRQRLVQKLEFLIADTAAVETAPNQTDLDDFYTKYQKDYLEPPVYTFTHVFFDAEKRGDATRQAAEMELATLNRDHVTFNGASSRGDRPLFFQNYVDRTRDFVVSHMGEGLTAALDAVEPSPVIWRGPFQSPYGWHLILMTDRRAPRLPPISELQPRVTEDYQRVETGRVRREAIEKLVAKYRVRTEFEAKRAGPTHEPA